MSDGQKSFGFMGGPAKDREGEAPAEPQQTPGSDHSEAADTSNEPTTPPGTVIPTEASVASEVEGSRHGETPPHASLGRDDGHSQAQDDVAAGEQSDGLSAKDTALTEDEAARELIRTRLDQNLVVEAAAGTGKTTNLVARLVALIAEGVAEPAQIAAITFTKKAAGELRERFQNKLEQALPEAAPARKERIKRALAQLDQSYLGTIHSFCGRMLRERPVEAGVAPDFLELEESEAQSLNAEVWSDYVQRLYLEDSPLLAELDETDLGINELRTLMLKLADETDLEFVRQRKARPELATPWRTLIGVARSLEASVPETPPEKGRDELQKLLLKTAAIRRIANPGDLEMVRLLKEFEHSNPKGKVTQNRWTDADGKAIQEQFVELCEEVVAPALREWREYCHPIALDIVIPAVQRARAVRIDKGRLSFQDLLTLARDLLKNHPHVRDWFRKRYRFVLVDEFQDTDPIQAEILFYLTGEGTGESWRDLTPRPGSLFIVGDPKQSIYRFRGADIALYQEVKELIEASGGVVLQLSRNFRSTGVLCDWVNQTFRAILPRQGNEQQAAMVEVEAYRQDKGGFGGVFGIQGSYMSSSYGFAKVEASGIASWIRDAVEAKRGIVEGGEERPLRWGDFMLLTRTRSRLKVYADALERERIPYEITGGRGFGKSEEITALAAFLRAVIDPDDQVSLVAYLRGPLSGVSDNELWEHRKAKGGWSYLAPLPDESPESLRRAYGHLKTCRDEAVELPPASVIGRAVERLGISPWSLALEGGQTRSGNLYKALAIARRMSSRGASLTAIVEELTRLMEEPNDLEELSLRGANENVVRLMNLHQAKGLEAPVVFLVDPDSPGEKPPLMHIDRRDDPPRAYVSVTKPKKFGSEVLAHPGEWDEKADREREFTAAENARLLYVAATRARQALVVCSTWTQSSGVKGPWSPLWSAELADLPELREERATPDDREMAIDVSSAIASIDRTLEEIRQPSWSLRTASGHEESLVEGAVGGRGASWGRVLHRMLEVVMKDDEVALESLARNLLRDEGRVEEDVTEVVVWVRRVKETSLWKRARAAERVLVEVPFAVSEGDVLMRAVADLVFRENGRWVVVDYKSDATEGRRDQLVEHYRTQIETYARIWHDQTGEETVGVLLFLDGGHEVEVIRLGD